jgi:hypothetical protein
MHAQDVLLCCAQLPQLPATVVQDISGVFGMYSSQDEMQETFDLEDEEAAAVWDLDEFEVEKLRAAPVNSQRDSGIMSGLLGGDETPSGGARVWVLSWLGLRVERPERCQGGQLAQVLGLGVIRTSLLTELLLCAAHDMYYGLPACGCAGKGHAAGEAEGSLSAGGPLGDDGFTPGSLPAHDEADRDLQEGEAFRMLAVSQLHRVQYAVLLQQLLSSKCALLGQDRPQPRQFCVARFAADFAAFTTAAPEHSMPVFPCTPLPCRRCGRAAPAAARPL